MVESNCRTALAQADGSQNILVAPPAWRKDHNGFMLQIRDKMWINEK